jgi:hypothetical protein
VETPSITLSIKPAKLWKMPDPLNFCNVAGKASGKRLALSEFPRIIFATNCHRQKVVAADHYGVYQYNHLRANKKGRSDALALPVLSVIPLGFEPRTLTLKV